jgi:Protein of unknown function (DUF1501)
METEMTLNRRNLIQAATGGVILGTPCLFPESFQSKFLTASANNSQLNTRNSSKLKPHFLLQITIEGGLDSSNLFDARSLSLAKAGLKADFLGAEPSELLGRNDQKTLVTDAAKPLIAKFDSFSILNGVVMSAGFDGHDQNTNFFFTGNPFGGDWFGPVIGSQNIVNPVESVAFQLPFAALSNLSKVVPLNSKSAYDLTRKLGGKDFLSVNGNYYQKLKERYKDIATQDDSLMAVGASRMLLAAQGAKAVKSTLGKIELPIPPEFNPNQPNEIEMFRYQLNCALKMFASKTTDVVHIGVNNYLLDAHAFEDAKKQPEIAAKISQAIAEMIQILKDTPFDEKHSFYDLTTFVITSEFSRTLRQDYAKLEESGTDHNPLTNTVLIGGKGIRSGLILGESDIQSPEEELSKVHTLLDSKKIKCMGRPFDCATGKVIEQDFESYDPLNYLSANSVANTLFALFDVPKEKWRGPERSEKKFETLKTLMV